MASGPDSKVHGANMGPTWDRQDPSGPHVGSMNFVIWDRSLSVACLQHNLMFVKIWLLIEMDAVLSGFQPRRDMHASCQWLDFVPLIKWIFVLLFIFTHSDWKMHIRSGERYPWSNNKCHQLYLNMWVPMPLITRKDPLSFTRYLDIMPEMCPEFDFLQVHQI